MSAKRVFVQTSLFDLEDLRLNEYPTLVPNPFKTPKVFDSDILKVKNYLQKILLRQEKERQIKFPSIEALVGHLSVTIDEVYKALAELKQIGFDYKIVDKITPIIVWDKLALDSSFN